ncbi:hypothetical protein GMD88_10685 [Pseudoflavonifractor sp. BIOML-A6]|nr:MULTISPECIES: hypothetical protein [unclassified Pseudoflavonifractor]MTQ97467.1 hypothetical protein [Pseudoflavonifractor sp. BIOML-A16]MTR06571.1 hypothetical protein [Pseudoflavonifractor sp. BIOML-A15]MTR31952.1 hypothetical protein [Pseudoflavonifractor sp. BIOML-A14]MTR74060.1 hypothetical protein [Pseudoflavonifractor sp. BIOML-A18]MTS64503.1 hypothetical protein [Pseudoflavonifractor sp. BIOML-A5]MTS72685.1 hypothetical protein [Pseudoflavonifractor sp. BIOML-A8]MTS90231.1 hypoth
MNYTHLIPGTIYRHTNGYTYLCASPQRDDGYYEARLKRTSDGWTLLAHGTRIEPDGRIHWDYSTDGYRAEEGMKQ